MIHQPLQASFLIVATTDEEQHHSSTSTMVPRAGNKRSFSSAVSEAKSVASTPSRKRPRCSHRRVHFASSNENQVNLVECYANLPQEEQHRMWIDEQDLLASLHGIRSTLLESRKGLFSHTIAQVYEACQKDGNNKNQQGIPASIAPCQLERLALDGIDDSTNNCGRGLESHLVESLALLRKQARRSHVRQVVTLHQQLRERAAQQQQQQQQQDEHDSSSCLPSAEDCLQQVASQSSSSARKFAQTLGLGDALAAMHAITNNDNKTTRTTSPRQQRIVRNTSFLSRAA